MGQGTNNSRGFTLIAALLILVLLSGVAAGLLYMVTNEAKMGGNDLEANLAFYGAESGMEKLTTDLSTLYSTYMIPTNAQIQAVTTFPPTSAMVSGMSYNETITYPLDVNGNPVSSWNTVSAGSNQGLYAEIIPMTMQVIATRPAGASVNMTRKVEIALIPVFQFGVFCGYDCSYFPGPNFAFGGRVHTNSNLFLATGGNLVFTDKIAAYKQIVTDRLENGFVAAANYGGVTFVPKASNGCILGMPPVFPPTGANCVAIPGAATIPGDASWSGGYPGLAGATNPNFPSISSGTLNGYFVNSLTGATNMQLPFVQNSCVSNPPPCTDPINIIRKPLIGEAVTSTLGSERLYNKAQIRILLADTVADLHPERGVGALDADDVQFTPAGFATLFNTVGVAFNTAGASLAGQNEYYGMAQTNPAINSWVNPVGYAGWTGYPLLGEVTTAGIPANGQGAWIRIEYLDNTAAPAWHGITRDWLKYGFSRQFNIPPTAPVGSAGQDPYNPQALIILQQMTPGAPAPAGAGTQTNFYPINFYDTREGEMRDNANGCSVNGIMNAVEINTGNLALWLAGKGPYGGDVGKTVNVTNENGYVLYFSDHRGMLPDPNFPNGAGSPPNTINGEAGLEDTINSAQPNTSINTDGVLEPASYYTYSPEDVDQNGRLDNWGGKNIGYGFGVNTNTAPPNPYLTIANCATTGLANAVSGARHVLKLVDGGMNAAGTSYLPVRWDTNNGGFTVASENPVYVQGDYNSGVTDPFWGGGTNATPHSAAAIIADAVTVLSNNWNDLNSLNNPTARANRAGTQTYYRMAISAGKNIPFPQPGFAGVSNDFGTDGGLHNFLRYLENWNQPLNYNGSLVSMYYAEYDTGVFKCCTTVYNPPTRNYFFDTLFLNPANLPPATPMFQDVVNLSYHQNFTPQ